MAGKKKIANRAEMMIYHALTKAVNENKLRIYLDYGKINRPQSPVYDPWETLLPILVPVLLGLILIIFGGVLFGLLFIIGMILIYSGFVKKKIHAQLVQRTKLHSTESYESFMELWNFGGFVLVNAENKKSGCVAANGDWKEFIVNNFADLMIDKPAEKPAQDSKTDETA